ncbi:hypothetical protein VPH35_103226 [Triticum aestivum]
MVTTSIPPSPRTRREKYSTAAWRRTSTPWCSRASACTRRRRSSCATSAPREEWSAKRPCRPAVCACTSSWGTSGGTPRHGRIPTSSGRRGSLPEERERPLGLCRGPRRSR